SDFKGAPLGVMICEDMWTRDVAAHLASQGAEMLIVPNGSPFERSKLDRRLALAVDRVRETGLPLIYVNQIGGQDELVFDGASFALNPDRSVAFQLPAFRETVLTTQWSRSGVMWRCAQGPIARPDDLDAADYTACMLGLRDYV